MKRRKASNLLRPAQGPELGSGTVVEFFLRAPVFPIIVRTAGGLVAVMSEGEIGRLLRPGLFEPETFYDVIDVTGEGFSLSSELMVISPLTAKKRWTKREVIDLYNGSGKRKQSPYPVSSLPAKRLDRIIREIAERLTRS